MFKNLKNSLILRQSIYSLPIDTRREVCRYIKDEGIVATKEMIQKVKNARSNGYRTPAELYDTVILSNQKDMKPLKRILKKLGLIKFANVKDGSFKQIDADGANKTLVRFVKDKKGNEHIIKISEKQPFRMDIFDCGNLKNYFFVEKVVQGTAPNSRLCKMLFTDGATYKFNEKNISEEIAEALMDRQNATYYRRTIDTIDCKTLKDVIKNIIKGEK